LGGKYVFEASRTSASAEYCQSKFPSRIIGQLKKGKSLDVIPVCMRESDKDIIELLMISRYQIVTQLSDARTGIEYADSAIA
jgi:hypothetical protein